MSVVRLRQIAASDDTDDRDELFGIIARRSYRHDPNQPFKLASGIETHTYFNLKATLMDPRGGALAAKIFSEHARAQGIEFLGGLELGAVPTLGAIAAISSNEGRPLKTFFVRKEAKGHGTKELIEGLSLDESLSGRRILIVDDVATKGGSIKQAIDAARLEGGVVETAMVIIDRERGAGELLARSGVKLTSLFTELDFTERS
ncbi:MAG: orotate phosphoribosyltransferase [Caulobacteraceae bacterium]